VNLEPKHSALITAYHERFGLPALSKEAGQAWTKALCETFAFRFPGEGWGWKRASPTRPESNESIARQIGRDIWSYDLIIGAGAEGQRLNPHAHPEDIDDQVFIPVEPRDHLTGDVRPPVEPLVGQTLQARPGTSPVDLTPVLEALTQIRDGQAAQLAATRENTASVRELIAAVDREGDRLAAALRDGLRNVNLGDLLGRRGE